MKHSQVIKRIHLSEKATLATEKNNNYIFEVDRKANKLEIKSAVEKVFKTKVDSVNTLNQRGKKKRERRADFGRSNHFKKAMVKLKEGETIDLV
jgi:large subunit ribosomal protein L23